MSPDHELLQGGYAAYWRLVSIRSTALREGLCTCCANITRAGDPGPRPVRAVARWKTPAGNAELLCELCLARWQANAAEDCDLAPAAVEALTREP